MELIIQSFYFMIIAMLIIASSGCSTTTEKGPEGREFEIGSVMKTDIDMVTENHQQIVFATLEQMAIKLYKRNPKEWKKSGHDSLENAVAEITLLPFSEVENKRSIDCIRLSFDEDYQGDRVKAYIVGLETMILDAYDGDNKFYLLDFPDAQKLYNSARNIEVASWLIRTKYKNNGELFLLSSGDSDELNLSFERLFGKIINSQDMIAQIMADRTHRSIKSVIQSLATAFIPI